MTDKQRPLRDLTRMINSYPGLFRDLVEACEEIAKIGSLEQAETEAKARMEKAREIAVAEHATLAKEIEALRKQAEVEAEKIKADAAVTAAQTITSAEAHRTDVEAQIDAAIKVNNETFAVLEKHMSERKQAFDKLTADVEALSQQRYAVTDHLNTLRTDTEALAAKKAELLSDIERLKAKF